MNKDVIIPATNNLTHLVQFLRVLLLLSVLVILAACRQELPETAGTVVETTTWTPSPPISTEQVEPTIDLLITAATKASLPSTSTAEPTSTKETGTVSEVSATPTPSISGALIQVSMNSQVGVLLDEIPPDLRDWIVDDILRQPEEYWLERARRQVRLTRNRLNFRNFIYDDKGQLPLPPEELWSIRLDPAGPERQTIQGHELVMIGYTFAGTLLTDAKSPDQAEPALAKEGGIWLEPFVFPADPDLLLQRTGNACVNEGGFPPNSFDSENIWIFYDYACQADSAGAVGCHRTRLPRLSCRDALQENVGEFETTLRFERVAWDSTLADAVRVGSITNSDAADLMVVGEDLEINRIIYRYIDPENCAVSEGSVGGSGWRRLLQFSATVHNLGGQAMNIGPVAAEDPVNHTFEYSPCHDHFHYSNYGDFSLGAVDQTQSSKQAFCVQSTSRFSNNELTPLIHNYSCRIQGIQAGWVDEYVAGLDSQWVDITDMNIPSDGLSVKLAFTSNGDKFLCEGTPVLDEASETVWEPSGFTTEDGSSINRPQCDFIPNWNVNNRTERDIFIPESGSFVTQPCPNNEFSPLRNCGFEELVNADLTCSPGAQVELNLSLNNIADLQVVRVCETSAALGTGLACAFEESLANVSIGNDPTEVNFICPQIKDVEDFEGGYVLYVAPIWPKDAAQVTISIKG